jgi:hypothetical protein
MGLTPGEPHEVLPPTICKVYVRDSVISFIHSISITDASPKWQALRSLSISAVILTNYKLIFAHTVSELVHHFTFPRNAKKH